MISRVQSQCWIKHFKGQTVNQSDMVKDFLPLILRTRWTLGTRINILYLKCELICVSGHMIQCVLYTRKITSLISYTSVYNLHVTIKFKINALLVGRNKCICISDYLLYNINLNYPIDLVIIFKDFLLLL